MSRTQNVARARAIITRLLRRRIGVRIYMAYDCAAAEDACNSSASRIHGRRQSTDIDGTVPSIVDLADFKGDWVQFLTGQPCGDGPVQPSI